MVGASGGTARTKGAAESAVGESRRLSPRQIARRLGVSEVKVRRWIDLGQLRAVDLATEAGPHKRRRLRISETDLAAFEESRSTVPAATSPTVTRRTRPAKIEGVTEFIE